MASATNGLAQLTNIRNGAGDGVLIAGDADVLVADCR